MVKVWDATSFELSETSILQAVVLGFDAGIILILSAIAKGPKRRPTIASPEGSLADD